MYLPLQSKGPSDFHGHLATDRMSFDWRLICRYKVHKSLKAKLINSNRFAAYFTVTLNVALIDLNIVIISRFSEKMVLWYVFCCLDNDCV